MNPIRIYKPSQSCIELVKKHEGEKLKAYLCPAGKWTIGVGLTTYSTGVRVKDGDIITKEKSDYELRFALERVGRNISKLLGNTIILNQNQADALISFVFNIGETNFSSSTLLKYIKQNPGEWKIKDEFNKWIYGGNGQHNGVDDDGDGLIDEPGEKKKLNGLVARRKDEADLYFKN